MSELADPMNPAGWYYKPRVRVDHAARTLRVEQQQRAELYPDEDPATLVWTLDRIDGPRNPRARGVPQPTRPRPPEPDPEAD